MNATRWLTNQITMTDVYAGRIHPSLHVSNVKSWPELARLVWSKILPYVFLDGAGFDPDYVYGQVYYPPETDEAHGIPTFMKILYNKQANENKLLVLQVFDRDNMEGGLHKYTIAFHMRDIGDEEVVLAPQYLLPFTSTGTTATREQMLNNFIQAVTMNRQFSSSMHMDNDDE